MMSENQNNRAGSPGQPYMQPTQPYFGTGMPQTFQPQIQAPMQQPVQYPFPPGFTSPVAGQSPIAGNVPGMLPIEQSYVENILRLNRGKLVTAYMTFENSSEQQAFKGTIEAAGRDHLILRNPQTNERYLLLMVYLDYVVFPERVEYEYPFGTPAPGMLSQSAPRASGTGIPPIG